MNLSQKQKRDNCLLYAYKRDLNNVSAHSALGREAVLEECVNNDFIEGYTRAKYAQNLALKMSHTNTMNYSSEFGNIFSILKFT